MQDPIYNAALILPASAVCELNHRTRLYLLKQYFHRNTQKSEPGFEE